MLTRQPAAGAGNGQAPYMAPEQPSGEVVRLTRPIEGHKGPISEIRFREPTAADWIECGDLGRAFVHKGQNGEGEKIEMVPDAEAIFRWMVKLTGYDRSVLGRMHLRDLESVVRVVRMLVTGTVVGN